MLEQNQTKLPQTEVNKRLRNLEEFCYRLSEHDIERYGYFKYMLPKTG